jgi:hypothetical protein
VKFCYGSINQKESSPRCHIDHNYSHLLEICQSYLDCQDGRTTGIGGAPLCRVIYIPWLGQHSTKTIENNEGNKLLGI